MYHVLVPVRPVSYHLARSSIAVHIVGEGEGVMNYSPYNWSMHEMFVMLTNVGAIIHYALVPIDSVLDYRGCSSNPISIVGGEEDVIHRPLPCQQTRLLNVI